MCEERTIFRGKIKISVPNYDCTIPSELEPCDWTGRNSSGRGTKQNSLGFPLVPAKSFNAPPSTPASSRMLNLASRSSQAWRSVQRLAKGMASVSQRIGDTKVSMSLLETGAYINYQRIEDNLVVVRDRYFFCLGTGCVLFLIAL